MKLFASLILTTFVGVVFGQASVQKPFDPYGCPYNFAPGDCGQVERFLSSMSVPLTMNASDTTCADRFWKAGFPQACCGYSVPQTMQYAPSNKVVCNDEGRVTSFSWDFLRGSFSDSSLANLELLKHLKIGGQANPQSQRALINGDFPDWILGMSLEKLELAYTNLSGPIPDLSKLSLTELILPYNAFTGSIPALPDSLTFLNLQRNRLDGVVAQVGGPMLTSCNLAYNKLCYMTSVKCGLQAQQDEEFGVEPCFSSPTETATETGLPTESVKPSESANPTESVKPTESATQVVTPISVPPQSTTILEPTSQAGKLVVSVCVIVLISLF